MAVMRSSPGYSEPRADTRPAAWWPLALLCMGQFALVLNFQVVTIALPSIDRGLDLGTVGLQWVVNANALAFGGLLLLAGRLADLYGAHRIFLAGLVLFAAASLGCALAVAPAQMIAARAAQGAGAAFTAASSLALLTAIYKEGSERTRALGFWGASGPLGGAAGIVVGGALASTLG
jgi:MFS family permease